MVVRWRWRIFGGLQSAFFLGFGGAAGSYLPAGSTSSCRKHALEDAAARHCQPGQHLQEQFLRDPVLLEAHRTATILEAIDSLLVRHHRRRSGLLTTRKTGFTTFETLLSAHLAGWGQ